MVTLPPIVFPTFPGSGSSAGTITTAEAQRLALLYEAGLNRRADLPGLNFWIDQFEAGKPMLAIADGFVKSAEFSAAFGSSASLSNSAFVSVMYRNVLGRAGEDAGVQYWMGQLQNGVARESILYDFAISPENQTGSSYVSSLHNNGSGDWLF